MMIKLLALIATLYSSGFCSEEDPNETTETITYKGKNVTLGPLQKLWPIWRVTWYTVEPNTTEKLQELLDAGADPTLHRKESLIILDEYEKFLDSDGFKELEADQKTNLLTALTLWLHALSVYEVKNRAQRFASHGNSKIIHQLMKSVRHIKSIPDLQTYVPNFNPLNTPLGYGSEDAVKKQTPVQLAASNNHYLCLDEMLKATDTSKKPLVATATAKDAEKKAFNRGLFGSCKMRLQKFISRYPDNK
ncbi:MAG: hypothetical protein WCW33_01615 [Candidatus Babeliales bacterium]|jgi:hypothetical protein